VSDDIKIETHAKCGGIAVVVPTGSVYGGSVVFCIKCMDDRMKKQESDLQLLRSTSSALLAHEASVRRLMDGPVDYEAIQSRSMQLFDELRAAVEASGS
jgi:hypothetical protein